MPDLTKMISNIKISDSGDILCDRDGLPVIITSLAVVTQDVKHAILENGLLHILVSERSKTMRKSVYNQLVLRVESNARIITGTFKIQEIKQGIFQILVSVDQGSFSILIGKK